MALDGIVLLDKPLGLSSHAAANKLRRLLGAARAGHVGSLDPLASGMLPVCLDEATKIAGLVAAHDKAYTFTLRLGEATVTGDAEGEVNDRLPVPCLERSQIEAALERFLGEQLQVPPMYSAIKQGGQPLYRLARQGRTVARAPRRIRIDALEFMGVDGQDLELQVRCGSGTYVRVLGEDIARALGTCGHLHALRRDWVAPFEDARCWTFADLAAAAGDGGRKWLLATSQAVPGLPRCRLSDEECRRLGQGQAVEIGFATAAAEAGVAGPCWLVGPDGLSPGLGQLGSAATPGRLVVRPQRMFVRPLA